MSTKNIQMLIIIHCETRHNMACGESRHDMVKGDIICWKQTYCNTLKTGNYLTKTKPKKKVKPEWVHVATFGKVFPRHYMASLLLVLLALVIRGKDQAAQIAIAAVEGAGVGRCWLYSCSSGWCPISKQQTYSTVPLEAANILWAQSLRSTIFSLYTKAGLELLSFAAVKGLCNFRWFSCISRQYIDVLVRVRT